MPKYQQPNNNFSLEGGERKHQVNVNIKEGVKKLIVQNRHNINITAFTNTGFLKYDSGLKEKAHKLRYAYNLPEVLLWNQLKRDVLGVDFHRQKPIDNYVVDLFCPELMLAIEVNSKEYDNECEKKLKGYGINFLRFPAADILENMHSVIADIELYIKGNKINEKLSQLERAVYNRNKDLF